MKNKIKKKNIHRVTIIVYLSLQIISCNISNDEASSSATPASSMFYMDITPDGSSLAAISTFNYCDQEERKSIFWLIDIDTAETNYKCSFSQSELPPCSQEESIEFLPIQITAISDSEFIIMGSEGMECDYSPLGEEVDYSFYYLNIADASSYRLGLLVNHGPEDSFEGQIYRTTPFRDDSVLVQLSFHDANRVLYELNYKDPDEYGLITDEADWVDNFQYLSDTDELLVTYPDRIELTDYSGVTTNLTEGVQDYFSSAIINHDQTKVIYYSEDAMKLRSFPVSSTTYTVSEDLPFISTRNDGTDFLFKPDYLSLSEDENWLIIQTDFNPDTVRYPSGVTLKGDFFLLNLENGNTEFVEREPASPWGNVFNFPYWINSNTIIYSNLENLLGLRSLETLTVNGGVIRSTFHDLEYEL